MCKTSDLVQDIAVLTFFKHNKPMFKEEYALRDETLSRVIEHGREIAQKELVEREYEHLLGKLAEFEFLHPEVTNAYANKTFE